MVDVFAYIKRFLIGLYETLILPFGFLGNSFQDAGRSRGLIIGLPAVLVVLVVSALLVHSTLSDNRNLITRYSNAIDELGSTESADDESELKLKKIELQKAKTNEEAVAVIEEIIPILERRDFYYRRLVTLEDATDKDKFELSKSAMEIKAMIEAKVKLLGKPYAETDEGKMDLRRAAEEQNRIVAILTELAPLSEPRYGPAHLFQAQQIFLSLAQKSSPQLMVQKLRVTRIHLEHALHLDDKNLGAKSMLGRVCMELRDFKEAAKYYEQVLKDNPLVFRNLRICYQRTDQAQKIPGMLTETIEYFRPYIARDKNNVKAWQGLTDCFIFSSNFADGEELLLAGYKAAESEFLKNNLSASLMYLYQYWIGNSTTDDGKPDYDKQKELISRAREIDKDNEGIKAMITVLAMSDSEHAAWAKGIYDAFADNNRSYAVTTAIVETAIRNKDDETAKRYLDEQLNKASDTVKKSKRYAFSLNNLSYYLLESANNPEPKRAMELVDEALRVPMLTAEEKNRILHTKARAHMMLGEYEEAIANLNIIREFRKNDEKYFEMLIECHQKVENPQTPTIELLQAELQKIKARNAARGREN